MMIWPLPRELFCLGLHGLAARCGDADIVDRGALSMAVKRQ
jgi:hypothetical protein